MNYAGADTARIAAEYERRLREIPSDYYSLGRPANLLMREQTLRSCIRLLARASMFPLDGLRVADIGCGYGGWLVEFIQWGADPERLAGIDLMPERLAQARRKIPQADLHQGSASDLPWADGTFDLVTQFLVFHNMFDPALKRAAAAEMLRVLRPGGCVLWFDIRVDNPRNPEIKALRAAEIRNLFPGCKADLVPAVLAPPLSRLLAGRAWPLAEALHGLRFLRTYYAGLIHKP